LSWMLGADSGMDGTSSDDGSLGGEEQEVVTKDDIFWFAVSLLLEEHGYDSKESYVDEHGEPSFLKLVTEAGFYAVSDWALPVSSKGWLPVTEYDEPVLMFCFGGKDLSHPRGRASER
jgi:hypothetical protein